jgi:hypothetical protein
MDVETMPPMKPADPAIPNFQEQKHPNKKAGMSPVKRAIPRLAKK